MPTTQPSPTPPKESDYGLFNKPSLTEHESNLLLEQYKLFVEMSDKVSERRHQANTFFLTVHTALITALTGFLSLTQATINHYGWILVASVAGVVFCFTWRQLIISYSQLNRGKFKVIHILEKHLPARLFYAEWNVVNHGDGSVYTPFTKVESIVPVVFGVIYIVLAIFSFVSLF